MSAADQVDASAADMVGDVHDVLGGDGAIWLRVEIIPKGAMDWTEQDCTPEKSTHQ